MLSFTLKNFRLSRCLNFSISSELEIVSSENDIPSHRPLDSKLSRFILQQVEPR